MPPYKTSRKDATLSTPDAERVHAQVVAATPAVIPEWVDEGVEAWHNRPDEWGGILPLDDEVRVILAGVLPHIVEHIAQRVEQRCPFPGEDESHPCDYVDAARIVREMFKENADV